MNRTIPEEQQYISCFAAFNHMRITRLGYMTPCCFINQGGMFRPTKYIQIWNKEKGLHDYWFNGLNIQYQEKFLNSEFHAGCKVCKKRIEQNIIPPRNEYDWNVEDRMKGVMSISYPKILEFEISNLCNMECPMCFGHLSSKHAANRDKHIDWGVNLFDDDENLDHLIEELKEFIPHLEEIRFVGGEPLAHKGMFKIAKVIYDIKPELKLQICTNGSVYNKKVEKLCKENNIQFSFSVDTRIAKEYEQIRIGGKFEQTYSNIDKINKLIGKDNININTTLMNINCENIIKVFEYSLNNGYSLFVNTYAREGRVKMNAPDWGLHLVPFDVKWKVIKQIKEYLREDNRIPFAKLSDNYIAQLNKVIILLS
jgi:MoaA/NifB/PqqE/SkfB family radical SAM enzyme